MSIDELTKLRDECLTEAKRSGGPHFGYFHLFMKIAESITEHINLVIHFENERKAKVGE